MNNPTKKINFVKFAELRPGVDIADCKAVLLSHWKEPDAGEEGNIYLYQYGCRLRIDINGKIGSVSFFHKFPKKRTIAQLYLGISLDDAKKVYPSLTEEEGQDDEWRKFSYILDENEYLDLYFLHGVLRSIDIFNPNAVYPRKESYDFSHLFPKANVEQCPFFEDGNFKLIVLSTLLQEGLIQIGKPNELASFVLGRYIDFDEDEEIKGYNSIEECREYLIKYPLTKELLNNIEEIHFDGSHDIYTYIFYHWDGESDEFDVKSIRGCENLKNLKEISMEVMCAFSPEEQEYIEALKAKGIKVEQ